MLRHMLIPLICSFMFIALAATGLHAQDAAPAAAEDSGNPDAEATDTVRTKAGVVFEGKITKEDGDKVTIETTSGPVTIPRAVIQQIRKGGIDYRAASEKIGGLEIPEGEELAYFEKAQAALKAGKHQEAAALGQALIDLDRGGIFSREQRVDLGKLTAEAFFELSDWPAAAEAMTYASRGAEAEVDRDRLLAVSEALQRNDAPAIGGRTASNFTQAIAASMRWKADQIFDETTEFLLETHDVHIQQRIERALEVGKAKLGRSERYIPGYSIERWPHALKPLVGRMLDAVEKAVELCSDERDKMIAFYLQRVHGVKYREIWSERIRKYLIVRQQSADCLDNIQFIENNEPLKDAYNDGEWKSLNERRKKLAEQVEDLKYYHQDARDWRNRPIHLKGKTIAVPRQ